MKFAKQSVKNCFTNDLKEVRISFSAVDES
jgi:hypothetical protein